MKIFFIKINLVVKQENLRPSFYSNNLQSIDSMVVL